jgi:hypothetical protein
MTVQCSRALAWHIGDVPPEPNPPQPRPISNFAPQKTLTKHPLILTPSALQAPTEANLHRTHRGALSLNKTAPDTVITPTAHG